MDKEKRKEFEEWVLRHTDIQKREQREPSRDYKERAKEWCWRRLIKWFPDAKYFKRSQLSTSNDLDRSN